MCGIEFKVWAARGGGASRSINKFRVSSSSLDMTVT